VRRLQIEGYRFAIVEGQWCPTGIGPASGRCSARVTPRPRREWSCTEARSARAHAATWRCGEIVALAFGATCGAGRCGGRRNQWARGAGMRAGRLSGSLTGRVFFPLNGLPSIPPYLT